MTAIEDAREQAGEALGEYKGSGSTPDWRIQAHSLASALRTLLDATEPRPITDEMVLAGLNATVKPESRAPDLSFWGDEPTVAMRASLEAAEGERR